MARSPLVDRLLPPLTAVTALLGLAFAVVVPLGADPWPALAVGVTAQLLATALVARLPARPHVGMAAVLLVAALLWIVPSPWQRLLAEGAVPWVPLAVAWATVRVLSGATTPRQLQLSGVLAAGYLVAVGATGNPVLSAAAPLLGGACASLAVRLHHARRDRAAALVYRARMDERQVVAARVHDTLGHVLTLLVMHANALAAEPATRQAGERMSRLGNQGLAELRHILTLLDAPSATRPREVVVRPGGPILELVEQARTAGQDVRLDLPDPSPELPTAVAGALISTVQEGLTNARRYAPGATVHVSLTVDSQVRLEIRNEPGTSAGSAPGTGRGLEAIRRRIGLLGGHVDHADTDDGGYAVRVSLPSGRGDT